MNDFWWGVVVTTLVGIPVAFTVNLLTPRLGRFLEAGSARLRGRNRKKAVATYQRRKQLLSDALKRDMHFVSLQALTLATFLFSGILFAGFIYMLQLPPEIGGRGVLGPWVVFGASALLMYLAQYSFSMLTDDAKALGDFAAYEKQLVDRFGEDVIEGPEEPQLPPRPAKSRSAT